MGIVLLFLQDSLVLPNQRKVVCEGGLSAPHHSAPGLSRLRGSGLRLGVSGLRLGVSGLRVIVLSC